MIDAPVSGDNLAADEVFRLVTVWVELIVDIYYCARLSFGPIPDLAVVALVGFDNVEQFPVGVLLGGLGCFRFFV